MSKTLILDWQKNLLLLARVQGRLGTTTIEAISTQAIGTLEQSVTAAEALQRAAQAVHAKGEVTVQLSREMVELRTVNIPKIDAEDLPDVIRYQAQRQFVNLTDAWIVDFVLLPSAVNSELQTALVAAISPSQISDIESACTAAGLQCASLVLRPLQLVRAAVDRGLIDPVLPAMIICSNGLTADALIVRNGCVVQIRSLNLPSETSQVSAALQSEMRRSLLAASDELQGQSIQTLLLVSPSDQVELLSENLGRTAGVPVKNFSIEKLLSDSERLLVDSYSSQLFAASAGPTLVGADRSQFIDFKNPKRRPPKQRDSRKWILAALAAAGLILYGVGWYYSRFKSLDTDIQLLREELSSNKDSGERAKRRLGEYQAVEQFALGSYNWLDELVVISRAIPGSEKIMLKSPTFSIGRNNEGLVSLVVYSTDTTSITEFEASLSKLPSYSVIAKATQPITDGPYRFSTDFTITVVNKGWDLTAEASTNSPISNIESSTGSSAASVEQTPPKLQPEQKLESKSKSSESPTSTLEAVSEKIFVDSSEQSTAELETAPKQTPPSLSQPASNTP